MQRLFGIPVGGLAVGLAVALGLTVGAVVALGLRNRVLLRLGLRNLTRRPGRAALIVAGLMLGTTIIASALATGDTMSRTVRSAVVRSLGETDELVSVPGSEIEPALGLEDSTRIEYFDESLVPRVDRAMRRTGLVDGVTAAVIEPVAMQDLTSRQTEARVSLFAADPARMEGFGAIRTEAGRVVSLADLRSNEAYINRDAAEALDAKVGDRANLLAGRAALVHVKAIVDYDGVGSDGPAVLLPLREGQALVGRHREIRHILVSNTGDAISGAKLTDRVVAASRAALAPLGLEAQNAKQKGLEVADQQGDMFVSIFTTFGSFSVAAGILLIFLIFVMLSAERRSELGIARAVGTRRGHLVQMFVFEGLAYDLGAAAVGAALGVGVSFAMVAVMASAFSSSDLEIVHAVTFRSILIAYALGVLLTFAVVTISAWRVSRLNIVAAVRGLPEGTGRRGGRRRVVLGAAGVVAGVLMTASGLDAAQATPFSVGVSLVVISLVPLVRAAGLSERIAYTGAGGALVVWWLLPFDTVNRIAGRELSMDFSAWIVSGLMVVAGATWLIVYNADLMLGLTTRVFARARGLAPVLKMAMAYPLRVRFRTGVTLAMFTLVVFTIVVGATTSRAFLKAVDDVEGFGGGFDVVAQVAPASPLEDARADIVGAPGLQRADFTAIGTQAVLPVKARQTGGGEFATYPLRGFDHEFMTTTSFGLAARARGYDSARAVFDALATRPDVAIVDGLTVPRRGNWNLAPPPDFHLTGFYLEDEVFDPVQVAVRDPQSGRTMRLTVIGVLSDTVPVDMAGIWTSQLATTALFGDRAFATTYHLQLRDGVDAGATARLLERAFLDHGMEATSTRELLHDAIGTSYTLNWLLLGFMGLGLVVGVAALGVVSARSVVERRQQIGVLRSIGFQRGMVQKSFLLESSFIALTAIVVGSALGLVIAHNVVADAADQPSWQGSLHFAVPWLHLAIVFTTVYAAALLTTLAPAARAARVYPAEALRYE